MCSLFFTLAVGSSPAFAQDTYFLFLDQTGANTKLSENSTSSWHIIVASGASFSFGGGKFDMRVGNSASADAVLTIYDGSNTSGTVLQAKH